MFIKDWSKIWQSKNEFFFIDLCFKMLHSREKLCTTKCRSENMMLDFKIKKLLRKGPWFKELFLWVKSCQRTNISGWCHWFNWLSRGERAGDVLSARDFALFKSPCVCWCGATSRHIYIHSSSKHNRLVIFYLKGLSNWGRRSDWAGCVGRLALESHRTLTESGEHKTLVGL